MNQKIKPRVGITKIALTGFQVFSEKTEFPIGKVNLLFGPNSAGKSAIEDAFAIIEMLKSSSVLSGLRAKNEQFLFSKGFSKLKESIVGRISEENSNFLSKLKSCWRKTGSPAKYAQIMGIEIESSLPEDDGNGLYISNHTTESPTQCKSICEYFNFYIPDDNFDGTLDTPSEIQFSYELKIDNEVLLYFMEGDLEFAINCKHPSVSLPDFSTFFDAASDIGIVSASEKNEFPYLVDLRLASFENSFIKFFGILGFSLSGQKNINPINEMALVSGLADLAENKIKYKIAFELFSKQFQLILSSVDQDHITIPSNASVSASRKIPIKDDLFIYVKALPDIIFLIESQLNGFSTHVLPHKENAHGWIYSKNSYIPYLQSDAVLQRVNYFLANQMFNEKGYYVGSDNEYIAYKNSDIPEYQSLGMHIKQYYLADPNGTRFEFSEVGSGLGYILPILCVLAQSQRELVTVQQPELHLHPALQANLGDVLIESAVSKTLMIETHSEHLLLRILKRIRQTHLQTNIAPELKVNADDVCVLYFDPSPDGTTTVKRLRITDDGEFMDRWPRGFFGERDQELLDE